MFLKLIYDFLRKRYYDNLVDLEQLKRLQKITATVQ